MEFNDSLPTGWHICKLRDVATIVTGNTPPKDAPDNYGSQYPWVKPPDLESNIPITQTKEYLSDKGAQKARLLPPETVLVSCIGILGKVGLAGRTLATNQQINAVIFKDIVIPQYGFYFCKTLKEWLENNASSTTVSIINKERFSEAPFIFPPLNEQRRIVAKLEVLLGKVGACQKRLEKISGILKRFRQTVLAAACDGRLTADWREKNPKIESAKTLLERVEEKKLRQYQNKRAKLTGKKKLKTPFLEEIPNNFEIPIDIPKSWCFALLGNIVETQGGIQKTPLRRPIKNIYPYLRVANVGRGKLNLEEMEYFELLDGELETWKLNKNDLLIVEGNGSATEIGRCAIWNGEIENCVHQNHIIRSRPEQEVSAQFLLTFMNSPTGREIMMRIASSTSGLHTLSVSKINNIVVPLAPYPEQQEIVRRVDALFLLADQIESRYQKGKAYVDKLTQSILAKAFRGELVPQDPNDEPASILLEKIKKESLENKPQEVKNKTNQEPKTPIIRKVSQVMVSKDEIKSTHLQDILKEAGKKLSPKDLWQKSGLGIDDFYAQLKDEVGKGAIIEVQPNNTNRYLEVKL